MSAPPASTHQVDAWRWGDVLLERYRFAPELRVSVPEHSHDCYQLGLALTDPGEYRYRGSYHPVPVGSISVIHPDEVHGVCGLGVRSAPTVFLTFYVPVALVQQVCSEAQGRPVGSPPFVPQPIVVDRNLELWFRRLHGILGDTSRLPLEKESLLTEALALLFGRYGEGVRPSEPLSQGVAAVKRAREFLDAHYDEPVSLRTLSEVAGLSAFHLNRLFRRKIGVPPHRYQLQRRIDRSKALLLQDWTPAEIAPLLGFSQQSHFGEQFRRFVNVSPGRYGVRART